MTKKLCTGQIKYPIITKPRRGNENIDYYGFFNFLNIMPSKVKRIRLICPVCGRRVMSSVSQNDGDIYHTLPPHKPKGWWKKKKPRRKERTSNIYKKG
jgi:hypothetical protein